MYTLTYSSAADFSESWEARDDHAEREQLLSYIIYKLKCFGRRNKEGKIKNHTLPENQVTAVRLEF